MMYLKLMHVKDAAKTIFEILFVGTSRHNLTLAIIRLLELPLLLCMHNYNGKFLQF